jgi:hypothetical protein
MADPGKAIQALTLCPLTYGGAVGGAGGGFAGFLVGAAGVKYASYNKERSQLLAAGVGTLVGAIAGGRIGLVMMRSILGGNAGRAMKVFRGAAGENGGRATEATNVAAAAAAEGGYINPIIGAVGGAAAGGVSGAGCGYTAAGVTHDGFTTK